MKVLLPLRKDSTEENWSFISLSRTNFYFWPQRLSSIENSILGTSETFFFSKDINPVCVWNIFCAINSQFLYFQRFMCKFAFNIKAFCSSESQSKYLSEAFRKAPHGPLQMKLMRYRANNDWPPRHFNESKFSLRRKLLILWRALAS